MRALSRVVRVGAITVLALSSSPVAFAQGTVAPSVSATTAEARPEAPVMVLQNRYFLKALRPEISLFAGTVLNESYSKTSAFGFRAGAFLTELLGLEYSFTHFSPSDSADLQALRKLEYCDRGVTPARCSRPEPSFTRLKQAHDLTVSVAPVYGKINLLDWIILYSDIYASAGLGTISSTQAQGATRSNVAGVIGIGQRFYFAKNFNVRIEATDHIFEEVRENLGKQLKGTRHAWSVTLGLSAFLLGAE